MALSLSRNNFLGLPPLPFDEVVEKYPPDRFDMFVALNTAVSTRRAPQSITRRNLKAIGSSVTFARVPCFERLEHWRQLLHFRESDHPAVCQNWKQCDDVERKPYRHNSTIGDHCFLTSHVVVSSHVEIGLGAFLA